MAKINLLETLRIVMTEIKNYIVANHYNSSEIDEMLNNKVDETYVNNAISNIQKFSGDYNDLTNKPIMPTVTNDLTNELKTNYDEAYTHSQAAHAPSNAQKNSDITKAEIENKLTGTIDTHTHTVATASADGLMSASDKVKLTEISPGANNYTHPDKHEASIITQDSSHLFVTQTEKNTWNDKLSEIPAEYITETELNAKGYATQSYVDNKLAELQIVQITKADYDALSSKDPKTLYLIIG